MPVDLEREERSKMNEMVDSLISLQKVNARIRMLKKDKESLLLDITRQEEALGALELRLEEAGQQNLQLQRESDARELKIRSAEEEIKKLTIQRNQIRNQKEYDAVSAEIKTRQETIGVLEDEMLEELSSIDENKKTVADLKARIEDERKRLDLIKAEVARETEAFEDELAKREDERGKLRKKVEPEILKQYKRLCANGRDGLVAVRGRICQGCHTMVPMQILNELMRADHIVFCHSCGRMLYLDNES